MEDRKMKLFSEIGQAIKTKRAPELSGGRFSAAADFLRATFAGGEPLNGRTALLLLFAVGLLTGFFIDQLLKSRLLETALSAELGTASVAGARAPSFANAKSAGGLGSLTEANPFGADLPVKEAENTQTAAISSFTLQGTLPGIGAWIAGPQGTELVLKGQSVAGYILEQIKYGEVVLASGKTKHSLYLFLSGGTTAAAPAAPVAPAGGGSAKPKLDFSGIVAASDGKEGAVPRELVDALLMNPYDELSKLRMTPAPDGSGMIIERIAPDSVFARVGVTQKDVISAVNGVNISNMADVANAVNSLRAGTRFDVTVKRGDKPLDLKYQVK